MQIKDIKVTEPRGYDYYQNWSRYTRAARAATRVYVWPEGESIMENLENRRQRPYTTYRKEVLPYVLDQLGLPRDTKVRWSQHAGCSMCPCSPGFIIDSGPAGVSVSVTITQ